MLPCPRYGGAGQLFPWKMITLSTSGTSSLGGAHCCQPRAARFVSASYFRHWGHFLDAVSKQCFALLPSSSPSLTSLFDFIWGARRWEQSNVSSTSLNFSSTVDFNKDICPMLESGYLCPLNKQFILAYSLWILSSLRSLGVNLGGGTDVLLECQVLDSNVSAGKL